jgi:hypothetical protein
MADASHSRNHMEKRFDTTGFRLPRILEAEVRKE